MRKSCVYTPRVRTNNGVRESKLFEDLLSFTHNDRPKAIKLYSQLRSPDFRFRYEDKVAWDDAGEVVFSSVQRLKTPVLEDIDVVTNILEENGEWKNGNRFHDDTRENYETLADKAVKFNQTGKQNSAFVATVKQNAEGKIYLSVDRINDNDSALAQKIYKNKLLNEKIRGILTQMGVSVGSLNELEQKIGERGVVDYERAQELANGMLQLIRLADGMKGEQALPEEFAHLVLDMMRETDPLVQRLIASSFEIAPKVLGEDYQTYVEQYGEDTDRLSREVAGQLVAKALMGEIKAPEYKSFFQRLVDKIKSFINKTFNKSDINRAIYEAEQAALTIANNVLEESEFEKVEKEKIAGLKNLYSLKNKAINAEKILRRDIDTKLKEFSFYTEALQNRIRKAPDTSTDPKVKTKAELHTELEAYQSKVQEYLGNQNNNFSTGNFALGIVKLIEDASKELIAIQKRFELLNSGDLSLREKAYNLRNIKNFLDRIEPLVSDINIMMNSETAIPLEDSIKSMLTELTGNVSKAKTILNDQGLLTFANYLEKFFDKTIEIGSGSKKKTISKDDLLDILKTADEDITLLDTWVMSAAESQDFVIKLTDKALKDSKERKRRRTLEYVKKLEQAAKKLPSRNTDFMFEQHENGALARRYKSEINWTAFFDARREFSKQLDEKYGVNPTGADALAKNAERSAWYRENTNSVGNPSYKYQVDPTENMTEFQKEYYKIFMEVRQELLQLLPMDILGGDPMKAVQVTKDMWERIKSNSPSKWLQEYFKEAKNSLITKVDDTDFGKYKAIGDFANHKIMAIPIFFTNNVNEKDLSHDTISTMSAFADMAINYDEMMEIADYLEIGRGVMERREAYETRGDTRLEEKLKVLGTKVTTPIKKDANNFVTRYNELLKSQLYGKYMNDDILISGKDWEIKSNKAAMLINKISSLNQLALNGLAGIAAVGNDMINVNTEALARQFFTAKELAKADKTYLKELAGVLGEMGDPVKKNKLSLFIEMFDVLHKYDNDIRDLEWDKSKIKKFLSYNTLYIFMHMGSHWGETRTALAQAFAAKIISDDGTETSNLWDILEVEYLNPLNPDEGARLKVKEGYTLSDKDITAYTRKFMGLNERLFGIYNQADRNALQATAIGQLVFLYRKFFVPAVTRRFGRADYNLDLDEQTEGFYRTTGRFLRNLAIDAKGLGRNIGAYWNDMTDNEKANCIRAAHEIGIWSVLSALIAGVTAADWDKKDNPWHRRFVAYMSRRMRAELGAFTPMGIGGETLSIIKSPAAAINTLEDAANLIDLLNPWSYEELLGGENAIIKSGRYKGHNKAYRSFMNSPFVPMNRTIYKMAHPEESIVAFR